MSKAAIEFLFRQKSTFPVFSHIIEKFAARTMASFCINYSLINKPIGLRRTDKYVIPNIYTNFGKRTRKYYASSIFNRLTEIYMNPEPIKKDKNALHTLCMTNVDE